MFYNMQRLSLLASASDQLSQGEEGHTRKTEGSKPSVHIRVPRTENVMRFWERVHTATPTTNPGASTISL